MKLADPLAIKFSHPTTKILKQRAKQERKHVSQLVRELIEAVLNGGRRSK